MFPTPKSSIRVNASVTGHLKSHSHCSACSPLHPYLIAPSHIACTPSLKPSSVQFVHPVMIRAYHWHGNVCNVKYSTMTHYPSFYYWTRVIENTQGQTHETLFNNTFPKYTNTKKRQSLQSASSYPKMSYIWVIPCNSNYELYDTVYFSEYAKYTHNYIFMC